MNNIFFIVFVLTVAFSIFADKKKLKSMKKSIKIYYFSFMAAAFGLLIGKYFTLSIPLPSRFFIHTVSPWFSRLIGL